MLNRFGSQVLSPWSRHCRTSLVCHAFTPPASAIILKSSATPQPRGESSRTTVIRRSFGLTRSAPDEASSSGHTPKLRQQQGTVDPLETPSLRCQCQVPVSSSDLYQFRLLQTMLLQLHDDPLLEADRNEDSVLTFLRFCHKEIDSIQKNYTSENNREFSVSTFWFIFRWDHRRGQALAAHKILYTKLLDKLADVTVKHAQEMGAVTRVNIGNSIVVLEDSLSGDNVLELWDSLVPRRSDPDQLCDMIHWGDLAESWANSDIHSMSSHSRELHHISHRLTNWAMASHERLAKVAPVVVTSVLRSLSSILPNQRNELQKGIHQIFSQYMWLEQDSLSHFSLSQLSTMVRTIHDAKMATTQLFANNVAGALVEICRSEFDRNVFLHRVQAGELQINQSNLQDRNHDVHSAEELCATVLDILSFLPPIRDELATTLLSEVLIPLSPIVSRVLNLPGPRETAPIASYRLETSFNLLLLSLSRILAQEVYRPPSTIPINLFQPLILGKPLPRTAGSKPRASHSIPGVASPSAQLNHTNQTEQVFEEYSLTPGEISSFRGLISAALRQFPDFGRLLESHALHQLPILAQEAEVGPVSHTTSSPSTPSPLQTLRACATSLSSLGMVSSTLTPALLIAPALRQCLRRSVASELASIMKLRDRDHVPQEVVIAALDSWASSWSWVFDVLRLNQLSISKESAEQLLKLFCDETTLVELSSSLGQAPSGFLYDWLYTIAVLDLDLYQFPTLLSFWIPRMFIFDSRSLSLGSSQGPSPGTPPENPTENARRTIIWRWLRSRHPVLCRSLAVPPSPHQHQGLLPNIELKLLDLRERILGSNQPFQDNSSLLGSFEGLLTSEFHLNSAIPGDSDTVMSVSWPEYRTGLQLLADDPGLLQTPTADPLFSFQLDSLSRSHVWPSLSPSTSLDMQIFQDQTGWLVLRLAGNPSTEELAIILQQLSLQINELRNRSSNK